MAKFTYTAETSGTLKGVSIEISGEWREIMIELKGDTLANETEHKRLDRKYRHTRYDIDILESGGKIEDRLLTKDEQSAIQDYFSPSAEDEMFKIIDEQEREELKRKMMSELKELSQRKQEVIRLFFGFDGEPLTVTEIAEKLGTSKSNVVQIRDKAIIALASKLTNQE